MSTIIKFLQLNTTVNSGSTGRIAEDIGQVMIANGHESYIAYGRGDRPSKSQLIKIGTKWDVTIHGLKTAIFDRHGFGSRTATIQLIEEIQTIKPDLLVLHNLHGYYLNIEILFDFLRRTGIPAIWTLFDCWAFTGHCTYFDDINCEKWKIQCSKCPKTNRYPRSYLMDNSKSNYSDKMRLFSSVPNLHLLVHSNWLKELVSESFLKKLPIYLIPTGIDTSIFHPKPKATNQFLGKKIVLGIASIWDARKGLDDFITLSDQLDDQYQIVLVGLNQSQLKKLPESMIGIKRTENVEALATLYSNADVFVNPTYQDNFPTTNLEALACGTPVITYDTGGSPEAIDTNTGIVVTKGSVSELKIAVEKICELGKLHFQSKCRERAIRLFNKNDRYQDYLNLYKSLLVKA